MGLISVIIPTLNEASTIGCCIEDLSREAAKLEIIIADGGSSDATLTEAGRHGGVRIVSSAKGRGMQMNAGAAAAEGDILLFLHADTRLSTGWAEAMADALDTPSVSAGAFTLAVDDNRFSYRLIELWVRLRCSLCSLPYGDQALFLKRSTFTELGGFGDMPLMEDVDMIERLKKRGRIVVLQQSAVTSGRRWRKRGVIRTAALNQWIMLLYRLGIAPSRLAELYYR